MPPAVSADAIEDLYDRSIVAWMIFENESDEHSRKLFEYDEVIRKAREKNPLRWSSDKLHQYKISEFGVLNPEKKICIIL